MSTISCNFLFTQQKRLRHLKSITGRNIQSHGHNSRDISTVLIFFTLHTSRDKKEFYTSEKLQSSLNPSWKSFSLDHIPLEEVNTTKTSFVVKVWRGKDGEYTPCFVWDVHFTGLVFIGEKLQQELIFPQNTLLFGMLNGFYAAPLQSESVRSSLVTHVNVHQATYKESYRASTLARVQTALRAIKQTEASGKKVRKLIESKLSKAQNLEIKNSKEEDLRIRIRHLQSDLEWRTIKLQSEKEHYETGQTQNIQRDMHLRQLQDTLRNDRTRLHERKKRYFDVREDLIKTGAQLIMRRKQLISELAFIYPIRELPNNLFTIADIALPNSTDFQGANELMLEVALGYTCHLVHMISYLLDMPVRYPMEHRGSKSMITDHIHDKLAEKDRDFPIYSKGREKYQFDYGVYLLNKNIAQLRYYCGLGTTDLRLTLSNLRSLMQLRLGVKFDRYESLDQKRESYNKKKKQAVQTATNSAKPSGVTQKKEIDFEAYHASLHPPETPQNDASQSQQHHGTTKALNSNSVINDTVADSVNDKCSPNNKEEDDMFKSSPDDDFFTKKPNDDTSKSGLTVDIDVHSVENNDPSQTPIVLDSELQDIAQSHSSDGFFPSISDTQSGRDKLLGSVLTFQDNEVSSSEDSANAVYRSKVWPKMLDSISHSVNDDSNVNGCVLNDDVTAQEIQPSGAESRNDRTFSESSDHDVDSLPTFKTSVRQVSCETLPEEQHTEGDLTLFRDSTPTFMLN